MLFYTVLGLFVYTLLSMFFNKQIFFSPYLISVVYVAAEIIGLGYFSDVDVVPAKAVLFIAIVNIATYFEKKLKSKEKQD